MIDHIDHLVLTVRSLEATCSFYERVLGFGRRTVEGKPTGLHFGQCKVNVHQYDHTFEPKAASPTAGSADFCLITSRSMEELLAHFAAEGVAIEAGPVERNGALGPMTSVYFRDPDQNLVEVSRYHSS